MGTKHPEIFAALAAPIHPAFIKTRKHDGAKYITARVVQNVLDTVLGPENWVATYERWGDDAVLCHLSITLPDGTVLTKCDVGSCTSMSNNNARVDAGDDEKGGFSDALKRVAVQFGVGRHLYNDGVPGYVDMDGEVPNDPPAQQRRPESKWGGARPDQGHAPASGSGQNFDDRPPTTGRALYAWLKKQDDARPGLNLVKAVNNWARENDLGGKMVEWDDAEIPGAYAAAQYFLEQAETVTHEG